MKWAYPDKRGGTSIRSPEVPLDVLVELLIFANNEDILSKEQVRKVRDTFIR
ncbi:hypothetical protein [Oceanobacillus salinisoli]|uniref:hypothetical protein n=1 Tax=Oceanobacillus salinisoli TaxID=2678611 RepID=UPI0012E2F844|nr:hypothetical protein [Oceanobacillus salinisoli]